MAGSNGLDWCKLVRIDSEWLDRFLIQHNRSHRGKVIARAYSIRFAGTQENMTALVEFMADKIKHFVYSDAEIAEIEKKGQEPWRKAVEYLGNRKSETEGKYGELLLFLLVEAVLKTPMIAHKIQSLTDYNDQVKGSDGVFYGVYRHKMSLLLGESKMFKNRNRAVKEALASVNKFYDSNSAKETKSELLIIRKTLTKDLTKSQLETLLNVLDIQSKAYQDVNKVHPVLIVYDEDVISGIEDNCTCKEEGEKMVQEKLGGLATEMMPYLIKKLNSEYKSVKQVYVDFFFLPVKSVELFRNSLYKTIHHL